MSKSRMISNYYLFIVAGITFIFLSNMAFAEPLCTNCSVNLVKWALPRAELLMGAWVIAMINETWMAKSMIFAVCRKLPFVGTEARTNRTATNG